MTSILRSSIPVIAFVAAGASLYYADEPAPPAAKKADKEIKIQVGETLIVQMSTKEPMMRVMNHFPKVVQAKSIKDDPRSISLEGLAAGQSTLTIEDYKENVEEYRVLVTDPNDGKEQKRRRIEVQFLQGQPNANEPNDEKNPSPLNALATIQMEGVTGKAMNGKQQTADGTLQIDCTTAPLDDGQDRATIKVLWSDKTGLVELQTTLTIKLGERVIIGGTTSSNPKWRTAIGVKLAAE